MRGHMCDFLGNEIKDMLPRKKFIEGEEGELEKAEEQPLRLAKSIQSLQTTRR